MVPPMPKRLLKVEQSNLRRTIFELHNRMQRHKATPELFIEKTTISKLLALLITLKTVQNQQFVWKRKGPTLNEPSSTSVQSPSRPLSSPLTISADIAEDGDLFQMSATLDGKLLSFNDFNTFFNSASFHKNITNMAKLC